MSQSQTQTQTAMEDLLDVPTWEALVDGRHRAAFERYLPAWIAARRWYRTKTKRITAAKIAASFPLTDGPIELARILLLDLTLEDGQVDTYVLPVAFAGGEDAATIRANKPHLVVLGLRLTGNSAVKEGVLVDALAVEPVLRALLRHLARGAQLTDGDATLSFSPLPELAQAIDPMESASPARLVSGEQTNSSILYGTRFVAKVVRKLETGESADLEVGRFLTVVGYKSTPAFQGWASVTRGGGEPATLALAHAFVPNEGDAWAHVLAILDAWLTAAGHRDGTAPLWAKSDVLTRAATPFPPDVQAVAGDHAALLQLLGQRVGEMHVALAARPKDPVFAPVPFAGDLWQSIALSAQHDLASILSALAARGDALPAAARSSLAAIQPAQGAFMKRLAAIPANEGGVKMRVHGDLHLGQVLFTGTDFMIIDFEGEPARSLEERKSKRSPLVDVAGMLRSFHYAAVSALAAKPEASRAALAPWADLWHRAATAAFVRGWLAAVQGTVVLPAEPAVTKALLDLFLLEKGIYEVHYEMNNRPDWLDIPLQGLRDIIGTDRGVTASAINPSSPAVTAFSDGSATHAFQLFGAHRQPDGATDFAVWAPNAAAVAVVGDFDDWTPAPLARVGATGIFAGRIANTAVGQHYNYRVTPAGGGAPFDKADPFAFTSAIAPGTASAIADLGYAWGDATWMQSRASAARLDYPISIYEVHLGSWRRSIEDGGRSLTYREIAAPLAEHAKAMGFTHVELMPLLEHPYYGSWGYGVTGFFAATSRYGTPADLMFLVDTLHQAGLGVIFDWVPAHFARDAHGLASFDGGPQFEPREHSVHPTWGTGLFDFDKPEVRSFLVSSATYWIETFHADGLRVDGVESILYKDHGAGSGKATQPNDAGIGFLRDLTNALKNGFPEVLLAAEDSSSFPGVTGRTATGGLGFDLKWDMGFAHDMRAYLGTDPILRSGEQGKLTFRSVYQNNESFVLPLSHDDVIAERGGSLLTQMNGDAWQKLANLRLLYAMEWTQPGKKLLFMGDELGQPHAWHHDQSLDWHIGNEPAHAGIARLVGDLNRLYKEMPALHAGDASPSGFEWIDGSNAEMSVVTFLRRGRSEDDVVLVAFNGTPVPRHQYRIGVPYAGQWREVFNSDAPIYGGSGQGNLGGVAGVPYSWNGRPASVVVTLPPLGAIILARTGK